MAYSSRSVSFAAFSDQKPGTSGLRKKTAVFQSAHYLQSFLQATFSAIAAIEGSMEGAVLVVGGDGRFFVREALQILIKMAHANKVLKNR